MRTVDGTLTTALLSGNYHPYAYILCHVDDDELGEVIEEHEAIYFELTGTEAKVKFKKITYESCIDFKIERGVRIGNTEYGLTTSKFFPRQVTNQNDIITIEGHLFRQMLFVALAADDTYLNVITNFCTAISKTASFADPTGVYWDYQFMNTGRVVSFNNPSYILNMLRQKYLMFAVDNGSEEVKFYYPALSLSSASVDWTVEPDFYMYEPSIKRRNFIWRDELYELHYAYTIGTFSTYPVHNLGYINSTASHPRQSFPAGTVVRSDLQNFEFSMRPDLRYQDGDSIYIASHEILSRLKVKEIWRAKGAPRWEMIISAVQYFNNTEGGEIPSTLDGVASYMPLSTGYFESVLSAGDNNVQAAFETVDNHNHLVVSVDAPPAGMVAGITWHYDTSTGSLYLYDGSAWQAIGAGVPPTYSYLTLEDTSMLLIEDGSRIILG